jgi:hypothetical protein
MASEWIIENCTESEINILVNSDIEWYPDNLESSDVCVYGTKDDIENALKLIGRKNN